MSALSGSRGVRLLSMVLALLMAVSWPPGPVAGQDDAAPPAEGQEWVSLGPPGPSSTGRLAVSDDRQIIVAEQSSTLAGGQGSQLIRTLDGGATWETLPSPARYPTLTFVPSSSGPVLYAAMTRLPSETGTQAWIREVLRSFDLGTSWETVVAIDRQESDTPVVIATPSLDGPVLAKVGSQLFRAADPRGPWAEMVLPDELQVQALAPSPAFARDGLIFAALIRTTARYWWGEPDEPVLTAHERSLGVAVSADGGLTWQPVGSQPQLDGQSYRHVRALAVSPTFEVDRTLFAHAWGPFTPPSTRDGQSVGAARGGALFRSRDAGASWEMVERDAPENMEYHATIALSPRFASDGVALLARTNAAPTNTCILSRSGNGGASWVELRRQTGRALGCVTPRLLTQGGQLRAFLGSTGISEWSDDGGQTWTRVSSPGGGGLTLVPATGEEATIYAGGSRGGVYARGPAAAATDGLLPCTLQPAPAFAAILQAEPQLRAPLGCPTELERPVRVRQRGLQDREGLPIQGYWIEGQDTGWIAVRSERAPFDPSGARWTTESKLTRPWPPEGHTVHDGAIQRFEGGLMLSLVRADGSRTALVLANLGGAYRRDLP